MLVVGEGEEFLLTSYNRERGGKKWPKISVIDNERRLRQGLRKYLCNLGTYLNKRTFSFSDWMRSKHSIKEKLSYSLLFFIPSITIH